MDQPAQPMSARLTYEDYYLIPHDGNKHEIIDGVHYMSPSPRVKHQLILGNLHFLIGQYLRENPVGSVILSPMDVVLSKHNIVQPDLLVVLRNYDEIKEEKNIQEAPDLAIEILSEGNRRYDEVTKRNLYESYGITEYWVVDPVLETIKQYRLEDQTYHRAVELSKELNDILTSVLLPDFSCGLNEIFS